MSQTMRTEITSTVYAVVPMNPFANATFSRIELFATLKDAERAKKFNGAGFMIYEADVKTAELS